MKKIYFFVSALVAFFAPLHAFAHEVYVLSPLQIASGLETPAFSPLTVVSEHPNQFLFWMFLAILVVGIVFFVSILRVVENAIDPMFQKAKRYAPTISRIAVGLSFVAAAHYQAIFGPELPLSAVFGGYASLATVALAGIGILTMIGWYTRFSALVAFFLFLTATWHAGSYMLTYTNYIGEIVVLFIIGAHRFGIDRFRHARKTKVSMFDAFEKKFSSYSFLVLRVAFGISLLYASLYAKFFHNDLALQVASLPLAGHAHSLAFYFGLEPHFLVLGAGIIEIVIALFFILGIEIRFTALFIEFWLALSLWYFGETVWPHIILIGIPLAFIFYGYDRYSLEGFFFKRGKREPVL